MSWEESDKYYVSLWINRIALGLMTILMVPTLAILGTWNTLPGEKLYPVKRTLENAVLALVGENFGLRTEVQAQLVDQRFEESQAVFESPEASVALAEFTSQIQKATGEIIANNNAEVNREVRKEKAEKLASQLREYEAKLETKKVEQQPSVVNPPATIPSNKPPVVVVQNTTTTTTQTTSTQTTTTTTQSVQSQQIAMTQQTIQQAIQMLEQIEEKKEKREEKEEKSPKVEEKHENNGKNEKNEKKD